VQRVKSSVDPESVNAARRFSNFAAAFFTEEPEMVSEKRSISNRRSAWRRFKRYVLLRPWVLNVALAIARIWVEWTLK
jgi:hypothetical protein